MLGLRLDRQPRLPVFLSIAKATGVSPSHFWKSADCRFAADLLGPGVQFDLTLVDRFPRHPSGKFRPYVSAASESLNS